MKTLKPKLNFIRPLIGLYFLWIFFVICTAVFAWSKSYFVDFGARPITYSLDLRNDKTKVGHNIIFVATQAEPEKYWWFGHLWVAYETTPKGAQAGTYQFGYYSKDQNEAAIQLALSYFNPLGAVFGQKPVEGIIKSDDMWPHHLELKVQVSDAQHNNAMKTDALWRTKTQYTNRPRWEEEGFGCQDYVFAIAQSIGLKTPKNHAGQFPAESFVNFAAINGVQVKHKWDFDRNNK